MITVDPAKNMNTDVFATFAKVLDVLKQPADTPAKQAALQTPSEHSMTQMNLFDLERGVRTKFLPSVFIIGRRCERRQAHAVCH